MFRYTALLGVFLGHLAAPSLATTLNFDGTEPSLDTTNPSGFTWRRAYDAITFVTADADFAPPNRISGDIQETGGRLDYFGLANGDQQALTMHADAFASFSLSGLHIKSTSSQSSQVRIRGFDQQNTSVGEHIVDAPELTEVLFTPHWSNLRTVLFDLVYDLNTTGPTQFQIGAIGINGAYQPSAEIAAEIPLPPSLLMLGASVLAFGFFKRQRNAQM